MECKIRLPRISIVGSATLICNVTKTDIKRGIRGSARNCPIAQAIHRATSLEVDVFTDAIYVGESRYISPPSVRCFINRFDNFRSVKPFKFTLG